VLKLARGIFAFGLLLSTVVSHAQTIAAGMPGNVEAEQGKAIRAMTIEATNLGTGTRFVAATNDRGAYRFSALPVGRYVIRFSLPGFQDAEIRGVDLHVGQEQRADIRLAPVNQKSDPLANGDKSSAAEIGLPNGNVANGIPSVESRGGTMESLGGLAWFNRDQNETTYQFSDSPSSNGTRKTLRQPEDSVRFSLVTYRGSGGIPSPAGGQDRVQGL